mmetsp:Transcript_10448/g.11926  ORF Transcript_10448/g.11926 Transcript_10448/m.11926 type:complete len:516 (+) Transcript_10448:38-1585(+)
MLSKVFGSQSKNLFKAVGTTHQSARYFGGGGHDKHHHDIVFKADPKTPSPNVNEKFSIDEFKNETPRAIKDAAFLEYKTYPNVAHNDPNSPQYIHSERDEYADSVKVKAYNKVVSDLKRDIKLQEAVHNILQKLDRPYKTEGLPGNTRTITGGLKNYGPKGDLGFKNDVGEHDEEIWPYKNENRFLDQTIFYPKYAPVQHIIDWQKEIENRPATSKFHADKGYKYDVAVPYEERQPHVADRKGYPEILGTPFERLMRLEGDIFHPVNLDQPFIQIPSPDPHPSLNFEAGEVIYENTQILEWAKFWNLTGLSLYTFLGFFVPYQLIYKTHMPLSSARDLLFVPYYNGSPYAFDVNGIHAVGFGAVALYASHLGMSLAYKFWRQYVVKMQYNKDKELVFVTRITPWCSLEEVVYEAKHLEIQIPSVTAGVSQMSAQDEDGLWDIQCMNSRDNLVVYNDKSFWNPSLRKEFFENVQGFWTHDYLERTRADPVNKSEFEIDLEGTESKEAPRLAAPKGK